jgi:hypothetical protein
MTRPLSDFPLEARIEVAQAIVAATVSAAAAVTDEFFERHPDWLARYGEPGRNRGLKTPRRTSTPSLRRSKRLSGSVL